jgi:hypothetical protein
VLALACLAVLVGVGVVVHCQRVDQITQENFDRIQPGTSRADLESLLGPRAFLSGSEMQSVVKMDDFAEVHVAQLRANQPTPIPQGADRLVWTGRDGVIVVTYIDGRDTIKMWLRRADLIERIKRQWHRWFP